MNKLILVIEDNKTIAMYEKETLKLAGYDVIVAHNLEEAKTLIKKHQRSIVLSIVDINLPDNKESALEYLLKHNIPSIAMTGSFHPKLRDKIVDKNVIDYIVLEDDQQLELLQATVNRIIHNEDKKVLIVDDSKSSRFALKNLLKMQNFTIFEADDGMRALQILKEHQDISIALIDYEMPKMNGAELTRIIRKHYSRMELSILAISVHSEPIVTIEFLKAGANDFITKPYIKEEVLARIAVNIDLLDQHHEIQKEVKNRKEAEAALLLSQAEAQRANQAKSNFLANMSHEVRTPMNAILGFVDILCKNETSEKKLNQLNIIKDSGNSLMGIIDDILDFSKIESGKIHIEDILFKTKEPFNFITQLFYEKANQKHILIELDIDDAIPEMAFGDVTRIRQIYSNLLSNAIKFSPEASSIEVKVSYLADSDSLLCSVKDFGCGIAQENQKRIFSAFEQEDVSTTRKFGGSGLGLSISKSLAKMMHGNLSVQSELDVGSTFSFRLPVFREVQQHIQHEKETQVESASTPVLQGKALIVEDNKSNQLLMKILLEEMGLEIAIANDGIQAVQAFQENFYDIILMDENMPNLNGIEATCRIRELEELEGKRKIPIIAVTANALKGDKEKFLEAGMDDYVAKPVNNVELQKVLRKFLST